MARLNTVDSAHVDRDLDGWLGVTTGPLHDQLTRTHGSDTATMKAAGTSTNGTVTDAAVTELDTRAGTAKIIVTVQVRLTPSPVRPPPIANASKPTCPVPPAPGNSPPSPRSRSARAKG